MIKNKLVLVAIVLLFTIALVSVSFLDCKKEIGTSDQVVIEVNSESDKDDTKVERLERDIIEDKNSEGITWLSFEDVCDQLFMDSYSQSDKKSLVKLEKEIIEDKNSEGITWLSTQQLNKQKQTYI